MLLHVFGRGLRYRATVKLVWPWSLFKFRGKFRRVLRERERGCDPTVSSGERPVFRCGRDKDVKITGILTYGEWEASC